MKRTTLLLILVALLALAPSTTDQLTADFNGTHTGTNATNNSVELAKSGGNYVASGTYESTVKDLGSRPAATISWSANNPSGTSLLVSSRAGNTSSPDSSWTGWSNNYNDESGSAIPHLARHHQYRLQLATTNNQTPRVTSVTLTYSEQGPAISAAASQNAQLDSENTGSYRFHADIEDTVSLTATDARYRIGTDSYTGWSAMTQDSGSTYYTDVPEPSGGWDSRAGETLRVEVRANNTNGIENTQSFTDLIDDINNAPTIGNLSDIQATEGTQVTIGLTASDPDGDNLTFTTTHGTTTSTGATTADLTWTPDNTETGIFNVTVTVSDGSLQDSTQLTANVTDVNSPPTLQPVDDASGHFGDRIAFTLTAKDNDTQENLTWWVEPRLFEIEEINNTNGTAGEYKALANFTALSDHRGTHNLTFWVRDNQERSSQNATLSITYCGDDTCQDVENASSCRADCYEPPAPAYVALEVPDRLCKNQTAQLTTYNASSRYVCYREGKTYKGAAYCTELESTELTIYRLNKTLRTQTQTLTTNASGAADWTPPNAARYKIVATHDGFIGTNQVVTVAACGADINAVDEVIQYEKPRITPEKRDPATPPELQRPQVNEEEAGLLEIIIWYIIVPLLGAALLYASNAYYAEYKDTDPRLLKLRLKLWEWRTQLQPYADRYVTPYAQKAWLMVGPYATPVWHWLYENVIGVVWEPLKRRLEKLARKL